MTRRAFTKPGFEWDRRTRTARFEVIVPGTNGKTRRRKTFVVEEADIPPGKDPRAVADDEFERFRAEVLAEFAPGRPRSLRAYYEAHWKTMKARLSKRGARNDEDIMEHRVLPHLGDLRLDAINLAEVRDWVGKLRAEGYAPSSINRAMSTLRKFLKDAVAREVLDVYPIKGRLPRQKEELLRLEMTPAEHRAFVGAFDDEAGFHAYVARTRKPHGEVVSFTNGKGTAVTKAQGGGRKPGSEAVDFWFQRFRAMRPLFVVALETGLAKTDLLGLKWTSVGKPEGWIRGPRKKTGVEAEIPISPACAEALRERRKCAPFSELVFLTADDAPVTEGTLEAYFAIAKEVAGIKRRLRFHDLRHTFASRLASQGVSIQVIAKALGHTSTKMAERYAKPSAEAMRAIVAALSADAVNSPMNSTPLAATGTEGAGGRNSCEEKGKVGTPSGIRTRDLHLERVTS